MHSNDEPTSDVPRHVAIIMDGNGRWAQQHNRPRTYGHKKGVEATRKSIAFFARAGVKQLTLFAFSSENWSRPKEEVSTLMSLFVTSLKNNTQELQKNNIRIRFIGDRSAFSSKLQKQIKASEQATENNTQMTLNVAANYGGQWDVAQAVQKIAERAREGSLDIAAIDPELIASELSLANSPDPDLFIRSGGEKRISNFLLWQLAYTELYFSEVLWPDFDEREMQAALDSFASRQRRYGRTAEQLDSVG